MTEPRVAYSTAPIAAITSAHAHLSKALQLSDVMPRASVSTHEPQPTKLLPTTQSTPSNSHSGKRVRFQDEPAPAVSDIAILRQIKAMVAAKLQQYAMADVSFTAEDVEAVTSLTADLQHIEAAIAEAGRTRPSLPADMFGSPDAMEPDIPAHASAQQPSSAPTVRSLTSSDANPPDASAAAVAISSALQAERAQPEADTPVLLDPGHRGVLATHAASSPLRRGPLQLDDLLDVSDAANQSAASLLRLVAAEPAPSKQEQEQKQQEDEDAPSTPTTGTVLSLLQDSQESVPDRVDVGLSPLPAAPTASVGTSPIKQSPPASPQTRICTPVEGMLFSAAAAAAAASWRVSYGVPDSARAGSRAGAVRPSPCHEPIDLSLVCPDTPAMQALHTCGTQALPRWPTGTDADAARLRAAAARPVTAGSSSSPSPPPPPASGSRCCSPPALHSDADSTTCFDAGVSPLSPLQGSAHSPHAAAAAAGSVSPAGWHEMHSMQLSPVHIVDSPNSTLSLSDSLPGLQPARAAPAPSTQLEQPAPRPPALAAMHWPAVSRKLDFGSSEVDDEVRARQPVPSKIPTRKPATLSSAPSPARTSPPRGTHASVRAGSPASASRRALPTRHGHVYRELAQPIAVNLWRSPAAKQGKRRAQKLAQNSPALGAALAARRQDRTVLDQSTGIAMPVTPSRSMLPVPMAEPSAGAAHTTSPGSAAFQFLRPRRAVTDLSPARSCTPTPQRPPRPDAHPRSAQRSASSEPRRS